MILSFNPTNKQDDDSLSEESDKEEDYIINGIINKTKNEQQGKDGHSDASGEGVKKDETNPGDRNNFVTRKSDKFDKDKDKEGENNLSEFFSNQDNFSLGTSGQISKIEFVNQSSSMHSKILLDGPFKDNGNISITKEHNLANRPEDQHQMNVMQLLDQESNVSHFVYFTLRKSKIQCFLCLTCRAKTQLILKIRLWTYLWINHPFTRKIKTLF